MATPLPASLVGRKLRFTFDDGPMAGKAFDHTFSKEGTVAFGPPGGKTSASDQATLEKIADGCFLASYLGPKGFTLTVVINAADGKIVAISSDGKTWAKQTGSFELAGD